MKKNVSPHEIVQMLQRYPEEKRVRLNLLMIDDESDHATINTKKKQEYNLDLLVLRMMKKKKMTRYGRNGD